MDSAVERQKPTNKEQGLRPANANTIADLRSTFLIFIAVLALSWILLLVLTLACLALVPVLS